MSEALASAERSGPDRSSPDRSGPDRSGPDRSGPDEGYQDVGGVSGLSWGERLYWLILAVTAGADFAAFKQIVALLTPRAETWLIYTLVAGFTLGSLTLAHFAGRVARDLAAKRGRYGGLKLVLLLLPWLGFGAVAFVSRLRVADVAVTGQDPVAAAAQQTASAYMFLVLYVGSGVIAAFGVYLTHNPLRTDYRRALRAYVRVLRRLSRTQPPYERALEVLEMHERSRDRDDECHQAAANQRWAVAEELKRYAAVQVAVQLKQPPVTDGMTVRDWLPPIPPPPRIPSPAMHPMHAATSTDQDDPVKEPRS